MAVQVGLWEPLLEHHCRSKGLFKNLQLANLTRLVCQLCSLGVSAVFDLQIGHKCRRSSALRPGVPFGT